jgi:hypothetical protein
MILNAVAGNKKGLHGPGPFRSGRLQPLVLPIGDGSKALPCPVRKEGKMNTTNILTRSGTLPSRSSRRTARQGRLTDGDVGNKACDRRLEREILPFRSKSVDILKQWR